MTFQRNSPAPRRGFDSFAPLTAATWTSSPLSLAWTFTSGSKVSGSTMERSWVVVEALSHASGYLSTRWWDAYAA